MVCDELLLCIIVCSWMETETHSVLELQKTLGRFKNNNFSVTDELLLEVGAGCYLLAAMANHSCEPNCAVTCVLLAGIGVLTSDTDPTASTCVLVVPQIQRNGPTR